MSIQGPASAEMGPPKVASHAAAAFFAEEVCVMYSCALLFPWIMSRHEVQAFLPQIPHSEGPLGPVIDSFCACDLLDAESFLDDSSPDFAYSGMVPHSLVSVSSGTQPCSHFNWQSSIFAQPPPCACPIHKSADDPCLHGESAAFDAPECLGSSFDPPLENCPPLPRQFVSPTFPDCAPVESDPPNSPVIAPKMSIWPTEIPAKKTCPQGAFDTLRSGGRPHVGNS